MNRIKELVEVEKNIAKELRAELEQKFAKGTHVAFMIMSGQKNPSTGVIIGYRDHGYIAVRHDQAKKYGRYSVRDVYFENAQII